MDDVAWLVLAVAAGGLATFLWIRRERWIRRRRRRDGES
jgi:uncharacterized membrane protein YbhN (UPF0104 family)